MISAPASPMIFLSVLLFLCSSKVAMAAPENCRDGMLRLHVANIANGISGRFGDMSEGDIVYLRDPREGCLVWLRVEDALWFARITEEDFANWHACLIQLRWENPGLSRRETWPSLSQLSQQGDAAFALALLDYVEFRRCRVSAVMMADETMGLVLPPRTPMGESYWAKPSTALRVDQTINLPRSGMQLAPLLRLTFAESGIAPLIVGPRGGVFDISDQLIARFTDSREVGSVRREVCQPDTSALGAPHLTEREIAALTGGDLTDRATFLRQLVGPSNTPIDIRAIALKC